MRAVLYADSDMEPITVIDIPDWAAKMLRQGRIVRFHVEPKISYIPVNYDAHRIPDCIELKIVEVWGEPLVRNGCSTLMLFTRDDELALRLRSELLPGQRGLDAIEYKKGFSDGLLAALGAMRGKYD